MRNLSTDEWLSVLGWALLAVCLAVAAFAFPGCTSTDARRALRGVSRAACWVEPLFEEVVPVEGAAIGGVPTTTTATAGYRIVVEFR